MNGGEFLTTVWPQRGPYLLEYPVKWKDPKTGEDKKGHKQIIVESPEQAYEAALELADDGKNVYFALGSLIEVKRDDNGRLVKGNRKGENIRAIRSFWLDIDVKKDVPGTYPSVEEAMVAVKQFIKATRLPRPLIVSSGAGLHLYWPLTEEMESIKWRHYANVLKDLTVALDLKADPTRTADRSSVLRVPETINAKPGRPVLPVDVMLVSPPTDTEEFLKLLSFAAESRGTGKPAGASPVPGARVSINVDAAVALNNEAANTYAAVDVKKVISRCDHLKAQFANPGSVPEPLWYAAMSVIRLCVSGEKACHVFSARDKERYNPTDVDKRIANLKEGGIGPALCESFARQGAAECAGCRWKGKVSSPINLGSVADAAAAPVVQLVVRGQTIEQEIPEPPFPFRRVVDEGKEIPRIVVDEKQKSKDADEASEDTTFEIPVYPYDIHPTAIIFEESTGGFAAKFRHYLPMEGYREFMLPFQSLDDRAMIRIMNHAGIVFTTEKQQQYGGTYVKGYIAELQKTMQSQVEYASLGWKDNFTTFIAPGLAITAEEITPYIMSKNLQTALDGYEGAAGTLDEWKKAISTYNDPKFVAHQITMQNVLASVLMPLSGYEGAVLSAVGLAGCGKSTAMWSGCTYFGARKTGTITAQDTGNALYAKLGCLNNVGAVYDESTQMAGEGLSNLAYSVSQGHGKARLDRHAMLKERQNWAMTLTTTSNSDPHVMLSTYKANSEAEAKRIFVVHLIPNTMTKAAADEAFAPTFDNYGHAGPLVVQHIMKDVEGVKARIRWWIKQFDQMANIDSGERYWSVIAANILVITEITNLLGFTNFDIEYMCKHLVKCVDRMRASAVESGDNNPLGMLAMYMNTNSRSFLICSPMLGSQSQYQVHQPPTGPLHGRIDQSLNWAYIDRSHFRGFCATKGIDPGAVKEAIAGVGALKDDDCKIVLGKGTVHKSVQTRCWCIDLNVPALSGVMPVPQPSATVLPMQQAQAKAVP